MQIPISTYDDIIKNPPHPDQDGFIAVANRTLDDNVLLNYKTQDKSAMLCTCRIEDTVRLAEELGPVENLYYDDMGRNPVILNIFAMAHGAVHALHEHIPNPSTDWMLVKPRKKQKEHRGMSVAVLFSHRKQKGVCRYVLRTSVMPSTERNGTPMAMLCTDVYRLYYENGILKNRPTQFTEAAYITDISHMGSILEHMWRSGIQTKDEPTQPYGTPVRRLFTELPPWVHEEPEDVKHKLKDRLRHNLLYTSCPGFSQKEAMLYVFGEDDGYDLSLKEAWDWPGDSGFEI